MASQSFLNAGNGGQGGTRRSVPRACNLCRLENIRCDRAWPRCAVCIKTGLCGYDDAQTLLQTWAFEATLSGHAIWSDGSLQVNDPGANPLGPGVLPENVSGPSRLREGNITVEASMIASPPFPTNIPAAPVLANDTLEASPPPIPSAPGLASEQGTVAGPPVRRRGGNLAAGQTEEVFAYDLSAVHGAFLPSVRMTPTCLEDSAETTLVDPAERLTPIRYALTEELSDILVSAGCSDDECDVVCTLSQMRD